MKNTEERGETKSAPHEIAKLPTGMCRLCGLVAVSHIVVDGVCKNTVACSKRRRRAEQLAAERAG